MQHYTSLKRQGCTKSIALTNEHKVEILADRHNIVEVIIANHGSDIVAGYYVIIEDRKLTLLPVPENGLYDNERNAIVCILSHLQEMYPDVIPNDVMKIIKLAEWQWREKGLFD